MKFISFHTNIKTDSILVRVCLAVAIGVLFLATFSVQTASAADTEITGYAWSDTIGWISFSGTNYGLSVASDGDITGYAWSDNIGWISANSADLAGCPSGTCSASMSGDNLRGWLRALSADGNGWDGWISLSGTGYGPARTSDDSFSGYAWGSDVVGWVDFSYAELLGEADCIFNGNVLQDGESVLAYAEQEVSSGETCTREIRTCSNGVLSGSYPYSSCALPASNTISVTPPYVRYGHTTKVRWSSSEGVDSCTVTGGGKTWYGTTSSPSGETSNPVTGETTFTLQCESGGVPSDPETATVYMLPLMQET